MPIYKLEVLIRFNDIETGKMRERGEIVETTSGARAQNIIAQQLGELIEVSHNKTGKRILIHQNLLYKIGGIETANRQLARAFADYNIAFIFGKVADMRQALKLAETCDVIIDRKDRHYEADVLILSNYDSAPTIINRVKAPKVYQQIHADFNGLTSMQEWRHFKWRPHERVDKVLAVSDTAQKGLKDALGVDSVVVPNVLMPIIGHRMVFLVLSRASREKGIERVLDLVDRFNAASKDFVLFLCSTIEALPKQYRDRIEKCPQILLIPPSIYSQELLRSADYLVQLSLNESYCYSVREALQLRVPVICSDIPEFRKLVKDGKNGYILDDDLSKLNINAIFNKKPRPTAYSETIDANWYKVLKGEL